MPAYVLLGDPGSGKSTSFGAECDALGSAGCCVPASDFLTFDPSVHPEWRGKTLFIDGLDEVRAGSGDPRGALNAIRRGLDALGRPHFRLSCREADWFGANDRTSLVRVSPNDNLIVLRLDPLADQDIERILSDRADIKDAAAFMATADEKGVGGFLENPQCLSMLADVAKDREGWPGSRLELFEQACLRMAREHNGEHEAAADALRGRVVQAGELHGLRQLPDPGPTGGGVVSEEDVLDAAGRLCAVILVSGAAGCAIAPGREDPDHPYVGRCGRGYEGPCRQAIVTKLFKAVPEAEGRFQPRHRHVAEFLAGRHLARLVDGGRENGRSARRSIPVRRILALMTGHDGGVVTALRGLAAWLAAQSRDARQALVERDPVGVGIYGDASRFSTSEKVTLLKALASESDQIETLLTAWPPASGQSTSALGALVESSTEPALRDMLTDPRRDDEHQTLVVVLLHLLPGAALPGLTPLLFDLVRDETRSSSVRRFALDALISRGDDLADDLARLLSAVHAGTISDPDDQLLGVLLICLYPGSLSPAEVWSYFSESAAPFFGRYFTFWRSHLVAKAPDAELGDHLDLLVARRDELQPVLRSRGLDELPAQLLARGLETHGERLETRRLYDWLGVGLRDFKRAAGERIRDWLTRRPTIQKAVLVEGLERCAKSEDGDLERSALDIERRLYGAGRPPDFGLWCLQRAEEATDRRVAGYFLDQVRRALGSGVGDDGLTHDHVTERTRNHPLLARLFAETIDVECLEMQQDLTQAEREREQKHREWLGHVRAHENALRENRCPPALLHQLAAAYFDVLVDVVGTTPTARLEHLFRDDGRLLEAGREGLRRAIDRDDLPDVEEIVRLRDDNQQHFLALPVLAGVAEAHAAGAGASDRLDGNQVRSALAFHFCTRGVHEAPWYAHVVRSRPEVVADVLVRCASSLLKRNRQDVPGLNEVTRIEGHAEVARHAVLPLLRVYPPRAAVKTGRLDGLLWAALRHADGESLLALIADKCARKSLSTAQRLRWLSAGAIASPEEYVGRLEACVDRQGQRARHVAGFFAAAAVGPVRTVESKEEGLFLHRLDEAHCRFIALFLGERLRAPGLDRLIRLSAESCTRDVGVHWLIRGLAALPDAEASGVLASLASNPRLGHWRAELVRARDEQLVVRRDADYRHPDAEQVCWALDDGPPANAGDLAALVTDRLNEAGRRIRDDNANGWRPFWNEDEYGRRNSPKHEGACRDAVCKELRYLLPQEVTTEPEVRYANDTRADIRVACRDFQVPVEIKKNGHRHLWSALREQLIARYARDPATDGYGIYVVLWFGEFDGCRTPPPPSGVRPRGPGSLRQRLQDTLTPKEARKTSLCVIDVSTPVAETR